MYKSGATTTPVWPTWISFGAYPASTAALVAPRAAPTSSTSGDKTLLKFSSLPRDLPPEITILASVNAGLSDLFIFSVCQLVKFDGNGASLTMIWALPPSLDVGSKRLAISVLILFLKILNSTTSNIWSDWILYFSKYVKRTINSLNYLSIKREIFISFNASSKRKDPI